MYNYILVNTGARSIKTVPKFTDATIDSTGHFSFTANSIYSW